MKKILLLCAVFFSAFTFAQGHETFDNLDLEGNGYQNGSFVGENGIEWTFLQCRGDIELNGKAITLGRNRAEGMELVATIPGGMGMLEFSYMQAFSKNVNLNVYVNGELVHTATSEDELEVIKSSEAIHIDTEGDVVLKFENPENAGQVTIDDIVWTETGTVGIEDANKVRFSYFPNPASSTLTITSSEEVSKVTIYNVLGQNVLETKGLSGTVDIDSLQSGLYIVKAVFSNGQEESFRVQKL